MSAARFRVLTLTNLYPSEDHPGRGTFIRSQVESIRKKGVEVDLLVIDGFRNQRAYLDGFRKSVERIREHPPDVIHAHYGFSGWVALAARSAARLRRPVPIVVSFLGTDVHPTRRFPRSIEVAANRRIARRFDAVIVKSEPMRRSLGLEGAHVVPNGVDLDLFQPGDQGSARHRLGWNEEGPASMLHVLFCADPRRPEKRFEIARDAVARVDDRLRIESDRWKGARLHVIHGRPQPELVVWLNAADVLVLPSRYEGSPNVVKEAMACNLPVVASAVGDVPRLLAGMPGNAVLDPDGETGSTADRFARSILEVARSGRTQARESMHALSLDAVAERILQIYGTLVPRP